MVPTSVLQIETEQKENLKLTAQKKTFNLRMFLLQKKKKKVMGEITTAI